MAEPKQDQAVPEALRSWAEMSFGLGTSNNSQIARQTRLGRVSKAETPAEDHTQAKDSDKQTHGDAKLRQPTANVEPQKSPSKRKTAAKRRVSPLPPGTPLLTQVLYHEAEDARNAGKHGGAGADAAPMRRRGARYADTKKRVVDAIIPTATNRKPVAVYVIKSEDGPLKIGFSNDPAARSKNLAIGSPTVTSPRVIYSHFLTPETARAVEKLAHQILQEHRIRGEWFNVTVDDAVSAIDTAIAEVGHLPYLAKARHPCKLPTRLAAIGISLKDFAMMTGTPYRTVKDWSRGASPTPGLAEALVTALELHPDLRAVLEARV